MSFLFLANTRTTRRNSGQPNRAGSHQWAQKQQVTKKNPQRNFKPVSRTQNGMVQTKSPRGIKESVQNSYHGAKTYLGKHRRQAVSSFQAIKPRLRPHTKNSFQPNQKQNHWPRLRPQRHSSFPAKQNSIPRLQAQLSSKPKPQQQAYSEDDIPIAYPPDQQQNANGGSASQSNGDLCSQQCSLAGK